MVNVCCVYAHTRSPARAHTHTRTRTHAHAHTHTHTHLHATSRRAPCTQLDVSTRPELAVCTGAGANTFVSPRYFIACVCVCVRVCVCVCVCACV